MNTYEAAEPWWRTELRDMYGRENRLLERLDRVTAELEQLRLMYDNLVGMAERYDQALVEAHAAHRETLNAYEHLIERTKQAEQQAPSNDHTNEWEGCGDPDCCPEPTADEQRVILNAYEPEEVLAALLLAGSMNDDLLDEGGCSSPNCPVCNAFKA